MWLLCCEWPKEDSTGTSAVSATFHQKIEQLKGASEEFHHAGVDFLLRLLDPDAAKRMTAEGAV
jgi:hypothetical protein